MPTGYLTPSYSMTDINIPSFAAKEIGDYNEALNSADVNYGPKTTVHFNAVGTVSFGGLASSMPDYFYNRILIEPSTISLGNLVTTQIREVSIWNAFLTNKTIENILISNGGGIEIEVISMPRILSGLEELTMDVSVTQTGPATIDALMLYQFDSGIDDIEVTITGQRVVAFPFLFSTPVKEVVSHSTSIITTEDGLEYRSLLKSVPDQQYSINAIAPYGKNPLAHNILAGWTLQIFALPIWSESSAIENLLVSQTVVNFDTRFADYRIGKLAIIWKSETEFDTLEIINMDDTFLEFSVGLQYNYPLAMIAPARIASMSGSPALKSDGLEGVISAKFLVIDDISTDSDFNYDQHLGLPVFNLAAEMEGGSTKRSFSSGANFSKNPIGKTLRRSTWDNTKIAKKYLYTIEGIEEIWEFKAFMNSRRGRQKTFYIPSFENDFILLSEGNIASTITIPQSGYSLYNSDRAEVAILTNDGYLYRSISSAAVDLNNNESITFNSALNIDASEIKSISFLSKVRRSSDSIEYKHLSSNVMQASVALLEVMQ